jgi:hypothetical protein
MRNIAYIILTIVASAFAANAQDSTAVKDSLFRIFGLGIAEIFIMPGPSLPGAELSFGIEASGGKIYYSATEGLLLSKKQMEANEFFKVQPQPAYTNIAWADIDNPAEKNMLDERLNTLDSEGAASMSPTGDEMLFTRAERIGKNFRYSISYARHTDSGWVENRSLGLSSNMASFAYPFWSKCGQRVYFSSDRQGGAGGMDIYYAEKRSIGWSAPRELPAGVNSPGDDIYPRILFDSLLVFSSSGHSEHGGFDLVYANILAGGQARNFGPVLNSAKDDVQILFLHDSLPADSVLTGYLVSDRNSSKDQLFKFSIMFGELPADDESEELEVEADFLLDDRLTDYAKGLISELQAGLLELYGSLLSSTIGPVSDGADGLEQGKRLVRMVAKTDATFSDEVQFLMANVISNLMKKQETLESMENKQLAELADDKAEAAKIEFICPQAFARDITRFLETQAEVFIRQHGIPAAISAGKAQQAKEASVIFESSAVTREKDKLAGLLRNMLQEMEGNYNLQYIGGSEEAAKLDAAYLFSGKASARVSRKQAARKQDVQELAFFLDDSVDVFIEILSTDEAKSGSARQARQQALAFKLPSMDFAVDATIADVSDKADYKVSADGTGAITLYDRHYEKGTGDYGSSQLYTIQLATLPKQAAKGFFKDLSVNEYKCDDAMYRYTTGIARSQIGANRLLQQIKNAGFPDAFVIEVTMIERRLEKMYSVIIASGIEPIPAFSFPAGWKVAEYKGKTDTHYRYAIGEFEKIEDALAELNKIKRLGYKGAFIENIRRFNYVQTINGARR